MTHAATTSRAARAARSASRFAVFAIAAAAAVFAALALTGSKAAAQNEPALFNYYVYFDYSEYLNDNLVSFGPFYNEGDASVWLKSGEPVDILFPPANRGQEPFVYSMRLPDGLGLEFNPVTRRLSGTPMGKITDEPDRYFGVNGYYLARDADGVEHGVVVNIWFPPVTIVAPSAYRIINTRQGQPIAPVVFPPALYGKDPISYRMNDLPEGLEFNEDTRRLSGTPTAEQGQHEFDYIAEDVTGRSRYMYGATITLVVNEAVPPGLKPAQTTPELGLLDRNIIRKGAWSIDNWSDVYTFRLKAPTELTIDLASDGADAKLKVGRFSGYGETYTNDNSGPGTDAKLILALEAGRWYKILASGTELSNELSYYTLRISSPDFAPFVQPVPSVGRIVARQLDDARIEFAWHVEGGDRVLPRNRYLPARPPTGRWLNSSDIVVEGVSIGRINVRVDADTGRVEFAFTPAGGERILPQSRYFPASAAVNRWLRSTRIEWIE